MYTEGAPDFVFDQGMYYPAAASYSYYCTGFESPGEWENHQMFFGADGSVVQHAGGQTENSPYLYYTPDYGYAQSLYNPYNPYIPGAVNGAEGPFLGHQSYSFPTYQEGASAPAYGPHVQPDMSSNSSSDPFFDGGVPIASRSDARRSKPKSSSATAIHSRNPPKPAATYQANSLSRVSERPRTSTGQNKQSLGHGSVSSAGYSVPTSTHAVQGKTASVSRQPFDNMSANKLVHRGQFEVTPVGNYLSDFRSNGYAPVHRLHPETFGSRGPNDIIASESAVAEQNRGPRTKNWKNQLIVKAYTTKAGAVDSQGDIIIHPDQYNKDDFKVDYDDAKFFVIKSYSEDDVHKSIKYNVWSSTPHGNKKLQNAYEDAQKAGSDNRNGCPIFLYFSVNASGMFCGVAEMVGPVDFHKDKDFWQQDKWSGSFPVKWHIIKDVPNSYFRHIILENNENKPVTNSRDTQIIMPRQGLEMLKIFKDYKEKTSLLDDFMYYENRQRIMHEDKTRLLNGNSFRSPFLTPKLNSTYKPYDLVKPPFVKDEKISKDGSGSAVISQEKESYLTSLGKDASSITKEETTQVANEAKEDTSSTLRIDSLAIDQSGSERKPVLSASPLNQNEPDTAASVLDANQNKGQFKQINGASCFATNQDEAVDKPVSASSGVDIVTVGSMPIKVNGSVVSLSQILTVGTIPLDPRSLK